MEATSSSFHLEGFRFSILLTEGLPKFHTTIFIIHKTTTIPLDFPQTIPTLSALSIFSTNTFFQLSFVILLQFLGVGCFPERGIGMKPSLLTQAAFSLSDNEVIFNQMKKVGFQFFSLIGHKGQHKLKNWNKKKFSHIKAQMELPTDTKSTQRDDVYIVEFTIQQWDYFRRLIEKTSKKREYMREKNRERYKKLVAEGRAPHQINAKKKSPTETRGRKAGNSLPIPSVDILPIKRQPHHIEVEAQ